MLQLFFPRQTGELKCDYTGSEKEYEISTILVLVKGLDNNTCAAFGKNNRHPSANEIHQSHQSTGRKK